MALPQFFFDGTLKEQEHIWLDEDNARHAIQVLRMRSGDSLQLTNGKGYVAEGMIAVAEKKKCSVHITSVIFHDPPYAKLHLCVAFTKNKSRNEWLLEKATELGVWSITPLQTIRTEREKIRYDRWNGILVSALLQSQQSYLPELTDAMSTEAASKLYGSATTKLVAHCIEEHEKVPLAKVLKSGQDTVIFIGPEGDFTPEEVNLCKEQGYESIALGTQRLRTETAAMAVCAYFNMINYED